MKDIHEVFTDFKEKNPEILKNYSALGKTIHESGPIDEKSRWLIKVGISGALRHHRSLETHICKAIEEGASKEEILHVINLLITTCGFPTAMEAYSVFNSLINGKKI